MTFRLKKFRAAAIAALVVLFSCTCTPQTPADNPEKEEGKSINVTGVQITRADLELYVGEGFHLGVRITPSNATNPRVTWSSDNESVATVSREEGQVKAVAAGQAVITATTVDGGFTSTCPVKVLSKSDPEPPTFLQRARLAKSGDELRALYEEVQRAFKMGAMPEEEFDALTLEIDGLAIAFDERAEQDAGRL